MSARSSGFPMKCLLSVMLLFALAAVIAACVWPHPPEAPPLPKAWHKVEPRLTQFDKAADKAASKRVERVRHYFTEREKGADLFAKDVLSWRGKWELVKDVAGYGNHAQYLALIFDRDVFSSADLKALVAAAVTGFMSDLDGQENELLVQLRADLADSDVGRGRLRPHLENDEAFRREYWRLSAAVLPLLVKDLHFTTSREVLALIAMDIGTQLTMKVGVSVAAELGLDVGILTTGFVGGAATLGVGLVVGLAVDALIDWGLKQLGHDPEAEIARHVRGSVKQLGDRLIDGEAPVHQVYGKLQKLARDDWDSSVRDASGRAAERIERGGRLGLRWQLQRIQEVRARLREEALRKLLLEGEQS